MKKVRWVLMIILIPGYVTAGPRIWQTFSHLGFAEKIWVLCHPFKAKNVFYQSLYAKNYTDSLAKIHFLDGDTGGGQLDAYRHVLWMALVVRIVSPADAYWLGVSHEISNYFDFLHHIHEEINTEDATASKMDNINNKVGIRIGLQYSNTHMDSLHKIILHYILSGEAVIIKKNKQNLPLDHHNQILEKKDLHGWKTKRILVPSHFILPDSTRIKS